MGFKNYCQRENHTLILNNEDNEQQWTKVVYIYDRGNMQEILQQNITLNIFVSNDSTPRISVVAYFSSAAVITKFYPKCWWNILFCKALLYLYA